MVEIRTGGCGRRRCAICRAAGGSGRPMPLKGILAGIRKARAAGAGEVFFPDHEPLIHPGWGGILNACKSEGLRFRLTTSGLGITSPEKLKDLAARGLEGIRYLLASFDPEVNQLAGGSREAEANAVRGLMMCLDAGIPVTVDIPVTQFNRGGLDKTVLDLDWKHGIIPGFLDAGNRFGPDIRRAKIRAAIRSGDAPPSRPGTIVFSRTGREFDFDAAACPYRTGENRQPPAPSQAIVEISPGKFALYGTDAKWTGSVVLSKNMRGLVSRRTTKGPAAMTRHEACKDCPKLAACGACFIIVDDRRPEKGVKVAGLKAVPPESIHEQCKAGNSRILISGYSTVCVFTDPDTTPPLHRVPAFEPWETADAAALHEFGVIDYDLDRDPMTGEWSLLLGRDAPALSREGRGIAVLQLSSACVARCVMCAMPIQFAGRWVNTVDSARLMEELYLLGYRTCDIFGGEITMRPDFLFLMALAKEVGMRAFFITTGHSLDAAKVDALASAGVDKCSVALDAKSPGLNDRIKGRPGLHGWAVKAVNLLLADGRIPLEVNTVLMSQNAHEMEALNRELARMGVERHRIFYCIDVLMGMGEPPYLTKRQALNFVKKTHPALEKASKRRGTLVDWCPPVEIGKRKPEEDAERISKGIYTDVSISCSAPDRELFITVDGLIYPCLNPTVFTLEPVGEVGRGKLADVLRGKRFQEFSNMAGKMPPCANCISKRAYTGRGDR